MSVAPRLLVADRTATRLGIRLALEGHLEICAEAGSVEQAIRAAKDSQPAICLIGSGIAGDPIAAVRGVCRAAPGCGVIVLVDQRDVDEMLQAVRAGAVGYLPGGVTVERLGKVVDAVLSGEAVLPRGMVLDLLLELRGAGSTADGLTTREAQVLGMLRRGNSTAAIAERLGIAPVTVRRHISELVRKLGVEDRAALVAVAEPAAAGSDSVPPAQAA